MREKIKIFYLALGVTVIITGASMALAQVDTVPVDQVDTVTVDQVNQNVTPQMVPVPVDTHSDLSAQVRSLISASSSVSISDAIRMDNENKNNQQILYVLKKIENDLSQINKKLK